MKFALGIEYDGSKFAGWQMQKHGTRTVQECVEIALSSVANQPVQVVCAGRTDTGVHAVGQVVHFECDSPRQEKAWVMGVNTQLPDDVSSIWAQPVAEDFSARFSATARQYRYIILNRQARPAVLNKKVTWKHGGFNVEAMHQAAQALLGEQDFTSFRSSACQAEHAMRNVHWVNVSREGDYIYIDIKANAFLHHMVRNIVGSLIMVGQEVKAVSWMADLMRCKDRNQAGPTAPADGLYLVNVSYPQESGIISTINLPRYA
ncbi:MAG: tRNA pseudouridine(38-40) synthase TruA [endosymbiont of Galathealinum brachiosum]|uniref:tRNA pseudouridine synthase A n=1 Tax=endosymbiont of Galathealinum brachiosum TaxID=2200906 RepID=A0A370DJV1_9GAMM|nr:MAG: tRNA pseudouridine(38-40) synthase TruA [endosymbiont of Galathealinum brachiosum]